MSPSKQPARPDAKAKSETPKSPKSKKTGLKSEDFPSGDEADREDGNAGPESKRKP